MVTVKDINPVVPVHPGRPVNDVEHRRRDEERRRRRDQEQRQRSPDDDNHQIDDYA